MEGEYITFQIHRSRDYIDATREETLDTLGYSGLRRVVPPGWFRGLEYRILYSYSIAAMEPRFRVSEPVIQQLRSEAVRMTEKHGGINDLREMNLEESLDTDELAALVTHHVEHVLVGVTKEHDPLSAIGTGTATNWYGGRPIMFFPSPVSVRELSDVGTLVSERLPFVGFRVAQGAK
jgi:hypothetical protein